MSAGPHRSILARLREPGSKRHLALVRISMALHLATVFASPAIPLLVAVGAHPHPLTHTLLPSVLEDAIAATVTPLAWLGLAATALMALGLFTRVAVPLVLITFVATQNYWFRSTVFHDDWVFFTFPLLTLSFARSGDAWSVDAWLSARRGRDAMADPLAYRWPIEALVLWFSFVYVAAGIAKIFPLTKGALWLSGVSAQEFAVEFVRDSPLYWVLGHAPFDYTTLWPFTLASIGTVVVELGALTLLFTHRFRAAIFAAVMALHVSIFSFGIPAFPEMALTLGVALLAPAWFRDLPAAPASPAPAPSAPA